MNQKGLSGVFITSIVLLPARYQNRVQSADRGPALITRDGGIESISQSSVRFGGLFCGSEPNGRGPVLDLSSSESSGSDPRWAERFNLCLYLTDVNILRLLSQHSSCSVSSEQFLDWNSVSTSSCFIHSHENVLLLQDSSASVDSSSCCHRKDHFSGSSSYSGFCSHPVGRPQSSGSWWFWR